MLQVLEQSLIIQGRIACNFSPRNFVLYIEQITLAIVNQDIKHTTLQTVKITLHQNMQCICESVKYPAIIFESLSIKLCALFSSSFPSKSWKLHLYLNKKLNFTNIIQTLCITFSVIAQKRLEMTTSPYIEKEGVYWEITWQLFEQFRSRKITGTLKPSPPLPPNALIPAHGSPWVAVIHQCCISFYEGKR